VTTDAELIGRSLAGDDSSFIEVVRRHAPAVSAYLARRAGRGPAEDLLGEVWLGAFGSRSSYDRSYPDARPWLFGIAHHTLWRYWRTRPNEDLVPDMTTMPVLSDPWPVVDDRIDGAAVMRRALVSLPPDEREILLLVVWEQLSVIDAGRTLGLPPGTARRFLHQARLILRDAPGIVALMTEFNTVKKEA
jgi:RNA polymerase sigma-70 factor (ECF subfamily)